jgi:hypothetical protein
MSPVESILVRHGLTSALATLSLLIFSAGMVVWAYGQWAAADLERFVRFTDHSQSPPVTRTSAFGVGWGGGAMGLFRYHGLSGTPVDEARAWIYREFPPTRSAVATRTPEDRINWRIGRFQLLHRVQTDADGWLSVWTVAFPMWAFLLFGIPPAMWVRRRVRARPRSAPC